MRKLHLVGITDDHKGLIFTARKGSKSGGYVVAVDPRLLDAVDDVHRSRNGMPPGPRLAAAGGVPPTAAAPPPPSADGRPQSALSPREMQVRLRAGRSIEEVAAEAGVAADWVARFAVPILAEQAQVVALARSLTFAKPRLGESSMPLGESVALNLAERGMSLPEDLFDPAWSAFQVHGTVWTVLFRQEARGRAYEAHWELDVARSRLMARNRLASDLGYVDPGGRGRSSTPAPAADGPQGAGGDAAKPAARSGRASSSTAGRSRRGGPSAPAAASRSEASRMASAAPAAGRRAATKPPDDASDPVKPAGRAGRRPSGPGAKETGDEPVVRGAGIRAATAQVASAHVAASRSVARSVLPTPPRPSASRRGGFDLQDAPTSTVPPSRSSSRTRPPTQPGPRPEPRMPAVNRGNDDELLLDDILRDAEPRSHPGPGRGGSARSEPVRSDPVRSESYADELDEDGERRFVPRPLPSETSALDRSAPAGGGRRSSPSGNGPPGVTRVRSGGPSLVPVPPARRREQPPASEPKRVSDRRDTVRVPSVLSPASGPDRGMPAPRPRRRLRRSR